MVVKLSSGKHKTTLKILTWEPFTFLLSFVQAGVFSKPVDHIKPASISVTPFFTLKLDSHKHSSKKRKKILANPLGLFLAETV